MSTTTSRLGLVKPALPDSPANFDDQAGSAWEAVDLNFGAREVSSNPASSFVGDIVKNTTDLNYYRWNGSKWQRVGAPNVYANSFEAANSYNSRQDILGGVESLIAPANYFQFIQNRHYNIRFATQLEWNTSTTGYIRCKLRIELGGASPVVGISSTLLREFRVYVDSVGVKATPFTGVYDYYHTAVTQNGALGLFVQAETSADFKVNGAPGSGGSRNPQTHLVTHDWGF